MGRAKSADEFYTPAELTTILNNAFVASRRPRSRTLGREGAEIPEGRLRKLKELAVAHLQTIQELVNEEAIRPEEAVVILAGAALFAQVAIVQKKGIRGDSFTHQGTKVDLGKVWIQDAEAETEE